MNALLLALLLFFSWSVVGLAALVVLRADIGEPRVALTAPITGTAVSVLPLFVLSNAGVPMSVGARPFCAALIVASSLILAFRPPRLPMAVLPVVILCVADLVLLGRPMFHFGFDWIANANGDMAYYVLSATHLMGHGLQSGVDTLALADNRDFSSAAQTLNLRGLRPGTQIQLAGMAAVAARQPVDVYMPMSLAIAMGGICAVGSLAMQSSRRWWPATVAAALLVASPMAGYGVLQQLLPQDWGLALAAALFAWLMRPEVYKKEVRPVPDIAVIAILAVALFVVAYEVGISIVLGYAIYLVFLGAKRGISPRALALLATVPVAVCLLVVNTFLPRAVDYIDHFVLRFGTTSGFKGLQPWNFALVPTALPGILGLRSLFAVTPTSRTSFAILVAAGLLVGIVMISVRLTLNGAGAGAIVLGYIVLSIFLWRNRNEFGLFKLYMYVQPFLAATVAVWLSTLKGRRTLILGASVVALVAGAQLSTLDEYVDASTNPVALPNASQPNLLPKFRTLLKDSTVPIVPITDNVALGLLEGAAAGDKHLYFISRDIFSRRWKQRRFEFPTVNGSKKITFRENPATSRVLSQRACALALPTGSQMTLNRQLFPEGGPALAAVPCARARNILVFIVSSLGQPADLPVNRSAVSFWQPVRDPSFPGRTFSGFGRYALLAILGSTPEVRVSLALTTSPLGTRTDDTTLVIPPAAVTGKERVRFPVVGRGSARVVSPSLHPLRIGGRSYIVLDMGRAGRFPVVRRPGVAGLWGDSLIVDPRLLTSYVRDVSLLSPTQYVRSHAPRSITAIPRDLENPNLEYSGIYEDGWVARSSYVQLACGPADRLLVRALVPRLDGRRRRLRLVVNGRTLSNSRVVPGLVRLSVPVPSCTGRRKVELHWLGPAHAAELDPRNIEARLSFIGIPAPPASLLSFPADLRDPNVFYSGIYKDGWLQKNGQIQLRGGFAGQLTLRALIPSTIKAQHLQLLVNGSPVAAKDTPPGPLLLQASVPQSNYPRQIQLRWTQTARIAPNDPRRAAALLKLLSVTAIHPPTQIADPPRDLQNPNLAYSGVYKDGWLQKNGQIQLRGGFAGQLTLRVQIPGRLSHQHLTVVVNGTTVANQDTPPGPLQLKTPIPLSTHPRQITLRWTQTGRIAADDPRRAAALLKYLAVSTGHPPTTIADPPRDLQNPNLAYSGVYKDGWLQKNGQIQLRGGFAGQLTLRALIPGTMKDQHLTLLVNGTTVANQDTPPGPLFLRVPISQANHPRQIQLRWTQAARIAPNDRRKAAALLKLLSVAATRR